MPKVQGLSKAQANYRKAENPKFSCGECAFMSRGWRSVDVAACAARSTPRTCDEFQRRGGARSERAEPRV